METEQIETPRLDTKQLCPSGWYEIGLWETFG
jgi:hypothetical protein